MENTNAINSNNQEQRIYELYPDIDPVVLRMVMKNGGARQRNSGRVIEIKPRTGTDKNDKNEKEI